MQQPAGGTITRCGLYLAFKKIFLSWKLINVVRRIRMSLDD